MSLRYSELLQQRVISVLQERQCLQTTIFMQDGVTPLIGRQDKALLSANFSDNHIISRHFRMTLPDLQASIIRHVAEIPCELLCAAIEKAIMRFQYVIDVNGAHIEQIL
ncbi:uncharacterized protein TNCT_212201 [Trichonephila clavata]|uniref:Uncharacterized protein n=1 Tax=Trichonephila clavata TaxID=2740835 RepID=A0A8X6J417_TRICU|nr:uncharacterized protein TNCT_212201 [Trichonephila clavata]